MELHVDDSAGGHPQTALSLGHPVERVKKADLLHQVDGVAGPPFGHRPAAVHGDAARAVDRGDLSNPRGGAVGVPVLDVMAQTGVMDYVGEFDGGVVVRLQPSGLLVRRHVRLDRGDQVVHDWQVVKGGWCAVEEEIQRRGRLARPTRLRDEPDGGVGPCDQRLRLGGLAGRFPEFAVAAVVGLGRWVTAGEARHRLAPRGRAGISRTRLELPLRRRYLFFGLSQHRARVHL